MRIQDFLSFQYQDWICCYWANSNMHMMIIINQKKKVCSFHSFKSRIGLIGFYFYDLTIFFNHK